MNAFWSQGADAIVRVLRVQSAARGLPRLGCRQRGFTPSTIPLPLLYVWF